MDTTRRNFLGATSAAVATAAVAGPLSSAAVAQDTNPTTGISVTQLAALANRPARHRQVFAANRPNGNVFAYIRNSMNGYQFGWSEGPKTLHAVAVFNGLGVAQGVGDAGWQKYRLSDVLAHAGAPLAVPSPNGNPWLHAPAGLEYDERAQASRFNMDTSIETLSRRGADWIVCDTAMITLSMAVVAAGAGSDVETVHRDLRTLLTPTAQLVPAGAATMNALQEFHFTFYDANV